MKHKYRSISDMEDDMQLLCSNARRYNEESSQIYLDSQELERAFMAARTALGSKGIGFGESMIGDSEEEDEESHMTIQSSRSSSIHVVELEGYGSDNSDGKECMAQALSNVLS